MSPVPNAPNICVTFNYSQMECSYIHTNPLVCLYFSHTLQKPFHIGQRVMLWSWWSRKLKTVRKVKLASLCAAFLPAAAGAGTPLPACAPHHSSPCSAINENLLPAWLTLFRLHKLPPAGGSWGQCWRASHPDAYLEEFSSELGTQVSFSWDEDLVTLWDQSQHVKQ